MLPLPDLDDRTFREIVEDSRKMIHKLIPQWTDENYHDPGITFIELFAWLTEMQQYYLNRITEKNEMKFLKLLGIRPQEAVPARSGVTFTGISEETFLPAGTKLAAGDQPFETEEPLLLVPARIEKVIVFTGAESVDCTSPNKISGVTFFAFGREAKRGSKIYLGFDRELPLFRDISLNFNLFEEYPVPVGHCGEGDPDLISSATVSWKFYGADESRKGGAPAWTPLLVARDETVHLSRSGRLIFKITSNMRPARIHPANDKGRYWICCTLEEEGYEIPPRIDAIILNTVPALQQDTLSQVVHFSGGGRPGERFQAGDYLSFYGRNRVQVKDGDGNWRYWKETGDFSGSGPESCHFVIMKEKECRRTVIEFGDGKNGMIPAGGRDNVRLISCLPSFEAARFLGAGSGLPRQVFRINGPPVMLKGFMLQVGVKPPGAKDYIWQDWERVDDFDVSGPGDRHYMLDGKTGEIVFGDNENGAVPEASEELNICIISCRLGGGAMGNVRKNSISRITGEVMELRSLAVTNHFPATGGKDAETIEDAKKNVRRDMKKPYRAVTCRDFEEIAGNTPGLRVARVKAIPLYVRGMKDYPRAKAPAQITVVVVPYSESKKPLPGRGFLETVRCHLNRHRLVTTEVHVIPPEYIQITVHAVVVVSSEIKTDPAKIVEALNRLLQPLDKKDGSTGWPFGRTVYKGDIYGTINQVDGVEYVKELWLNAEGSGVRKDHSGDIHIPPYGLVYSGEHQIEAVSWENL